MSEQLHPSELGIPEPQQEAPREKATRHVKTAAQKLADLESQLAKVQAEVRRMDAHRKIILGGACMAVLREQPTDILVFKRLLKEKVSPKDLHVISDLFP